MDITANEALSLFRKWMDEHRVVQCAFRVRVPESHAKLLGSIDAVTSDMLIINARKSKLVLGHAFSAEISLTGADYDYVEGRHVAQEFRPKLEGYDAFITITYPNSELSIGLAVIPPLEEFMQS